MKLWWVSLSNMTEPDPEKQWIGAVVVEAPHEMAAKNAVVRRPEVNGIAAADPLYHFAWDVLAFEVDPDDVPEGDRDRLLTIADAERLGCHISDFTDGVETRRVR